MYFWEIPKKWKIQNFKRYVPYRPPQRAYTQTGLVRGHTVILKSYKVILLGRSYKKSYKSHTFWKFLSESHTFCHFPISSLFTVWQIDKFCTIMLESAILEYKNAKIFAPTARSISSSLSNVKYTTPYIACLQ